MTDVTRPAPGTLTGERIVVRPYQDDDAEPLYEAIASSRDHLAPWFPWVAAQTDVGASLTYVRHCQAQHLLREDFPLGIFLKDGQYLGGTGLHPRDWNVPAFEIGYWIRREAEGKGYVTEAVRLLTTCAFEHLGAQRLMIRCNARNERSRQVAERLGFVYEGRLRHFERDTSGILADMLYFSLVPDDYVGLPWHT